MIYAISDLHLGLGLNQSKSMDMFGSNWKDHHEKLKQRWNETVTDKDTVLISGDLSWAMSFDEFLPDLEFIKSLTGNKIMINGNHDYWWKSTAALNQLDENIFFLKNNYIECENYNICGTRGWITPLDEEFSVHDQKIYVRELGRLNRSLLEAQKQNNDKETIVMLHYPPLYRSQATGFVDLIEQFNVKTVVYGHLHGEVSKKSLKVEKDGVIYYLTSCDLIDFLPVLIKE